MNDNNFTDIYAAATTKDGIIPGIPGVVIPEKKTPSQKAYDTMDKRVYKSNYYMQELAANDDVFSILTRIASACMIGQWSLSAPDPEAAEKTVAEMKLWVSQTDLIKVFTGAAFNSDDRGALHNWYTHGKMAIYALRDGAAGSGKIAKFHNLPVDGLVRMTDPKNPLNYYFYQKLKLVSDYTNPAAFDDVNSVSDEANVSSNEQVIWYILGGEKSRDETGDDGNKLYPKIGMNDWVLALEDLLYIRNPFPVLNEETVTTIMNKRYLLRMSILAGQYGLAPFDKLTFGSEEFPPVPAPDTNIKTSNPTLYGQQVAAYKQYEDGMAATLDSLFDATTNGKPFATHPGIKHERFEPHMALTAEFVEQLLGTYNDVIARATGIPLSIIQSMGTELATSRLTKSVVDIALMAQQLQFNDIITELMKKQFEKELTVDGIEVVLQPLDKADSKTQAEIEVLVSQAAELLTRSGATPDTIQKYILGSQDMPIREAEFVALGTTTETAPIDEDKTTTRIIK